MKQLKQIKKRHENGKYSLEVSIIIDYINENYHQNNESLPQSIFNLGINYHNVRRKFKKQLNLTLLSYLNLVRIKKAMSLLQNNDLLLTDIAKMIGYDREEHFNKVFKRINGVFPLFFRHKLQKKALVSATLKKTRQIIAQKHRLTLY